MNPQELIAIARALVDGVIAGGGGMAGQTELRRAVSCAYYAMFHTLAASNANTLVGASEADQSRWAWLQTYRAADHRPTRNKLNGASLGGRFPRSIQQFGVVFTDAQERRHLADYNPQRQFYPDDVIDLIVRVEDAITAFNQTPEDVRRDLAIHILTAPRND